MEFLLVQVSEFELMESMFTPEEFTYNKEVIDMMRNMINEEDSKAEVKPHKPIPLFSFKIRIPVECEAKKNTFMFLETQFPSRYPEESPLLLLYCDFISSQSHGELNNQLNEYAKKMLGETCMISCVNWVQEHGGPHVESFLKPQELLPHYEPPSSSTECSICITDFEDELDELVTVTTCKHKFCKECLSNYITFKTSDVQALYHHVTFLSCERNSEKSKVLKIEDTKTYGIPCPAQKCKHVMLIPELLPLATPAALENFQKFSELHKQNLGLVERRREDMEQAKNAKPFCPKWGCHSGKWIAAKRGRLKCAECGCPVCKNCYQNHARGIACDDFAQGKLPHMKIKGLVQCPKCTAFTERIDGCNYMTCTCGQPFCYLCGTSIEQSKHFSHFLNEPFGNCCKGPKDKSKLLT